MFEIIISITLFTSIILFLVVVILFARSRLVPAAPVHVEISGYPEKSFDTSAGGKLLLTLADRDIFLPSACGGSGICGQCRVMVLEGGGEILPSEKDFFTRKEREQGFHLACQLNLKRDLELELPPEVFQVRKWECEVVSNENVATFIKELVVKLPAGESIDFEPGSYVQIEAPPHWLKFTDIDVAAEYRPDWDQLKLWDQESVVSKPVTRAYTMANYPGEEGGIKFNIRIGLPPPGSKSIPPGKMSSYLFHLKPGDKLMMSGPYGEFFPKHTDAEMIYVGGGSGMAPMRSHIFHLLKEVGTGRKISYWYGARSLREMFYIEDFDQLQEQYDNFEWNVALSQPQPEDDWQGYSGYVNHLLYENYLKEHPNPEACEYYLCGPPPMLIALIEILHNLGVEDENIMFDDFCP